MIIQNVMHEKMIKGLILIHFESYMMYINAQTRATYQVML